MAYLKHVDDEVTARRLDSDDEEEEKFDKLRLCRRSRGGHDDDVQT